MKFDEVEKNLKELRIRNYHRVWEPFMRKYKCDYVCELGVFKGDNFFPMISHNPRIAVAVDTWNNDGVHSKRDASYSREELGSQYEYFKRAVDSLPFVQIIREDTAKAAIQFPDNYFDFVYIDADHSTEACYQDLVNWYPKV